MKRADDFGSLTPHKAEADPFLFPLACLYLLSSLYLCLILGF
jgi:hypothetical protein